MVVERGTIKKKACATKITFVQVLPRRRERDADLADVGNSGRHRRQQHLHVEVLQRVQKHVQVRSELCYNHIVVCLMIDLSSG